MENLIFTAQKKERETKRHTSPGPGHRERCSETVAFKLGLER